MRIPTWAIAVLSLPAFLPPLLPAAEVTENLILDGGMEEWRTTGPQDSWWNYLTVSCKKVQFDRDEQARVLTPKTFSQTCDLKLMKPESADVHSGRKALRLKGQFYLREVTADAMNTKDGDVYLVRYWVKGAGQSVLHLTVYGDAREEIVEVRGRPDRDRWSAIEQRIQVVGRAPTTVYPRLWASEEMLIDDVSMVRVLRPGERKLEPVSSDCQQRVAFAWAADGPITLDGRLDEPAWAKAVAFGGFRSTDDQTLLAAVQPSFRVLADATNLHFGFEIPLAGASQVREELLTRPLLDRAGKPRPKRDTYASRESIELFLQAPGRSRYVQLVAALDGYCHDSAGQEAAWNGTWQFALQADDDRWFLEMRVPVEDLGHLRTAPAEGWALNVCCNQQRGSSSWAAVGPNFHSPAGFGRLVVRDFPAWCAEQPAVRRRKKAEILAAAGAHAGHYAGRLARIEAADAARAAETGDLRDWQSITRTYSQLEYLGAALRAVGEDVRYAKFFQ